MKASSAGPHVALVTDRGYVPWAGVALRSLLDHHPEARATVLHDAAAAPEAALAADDIAALEGLAPGQVEVRAVVDDRLAGLPAIDRFGTVVWLRFLLPDLLADEERVLYLDADVLIADRLDDLWSDPLSAGPVGAVDNVVEPALASHVRSVVGDRAYFNSGVLLLDLARLRDDGVVEEMLARARTGQLRWPDQDVLNATFAGRWTRLAPRHNAQSSFWVWADLADEVLGADARAAAVAEPAIVHFEGPGVCKPWHPLCEHPWRDRYLATLARTPWAGAETGWRTPLSRALRLLPRSWRIPAHVRLAPRLERSP